ncbi:MAG: VOC family protein, partial [Ardenticatenales bacterium]|nr:VOC family protein [Ardenticatenales bacterium]
MQRVVGISEIVLWADEIEAMVEWYRDFLGLEQLSPPERKSPVFLKAGEGNAGIPQMIVIVQKPEEIKAMASGYQLHHLALELPPEAFDAQQAMFEERGQAVRGGIHPVIAARTFYVDDPNGNEVEFICRTEQ